MFRLISLLVVVAILAVLWLTFAESTTGSACTERNGTTTTLPVELTKGLGAGAADLVNDC